VVAIDVRFVVGAPFQQDKFPQTRPIAKFHPKTAHGKLKAEITPINLRCAII